MGGFIPPQEHDNQGTGMIAHQPIPVSDEDQTLLSVTVRMVTARPGSAFATVTLRALVPGIERLDTSTGLGSPEFGREVASALPFACRCVVAPQDNDWSTIETVSKAMSRAAKQDVGKQAALVALRAAGFSYAVDAIGGPILVNVALQSLFSASNLNTAPRSPISFDAR